MKTPRILLFFAILLFLFGLLDFLLAIRNPFLEENIAVVGLYNIIGAYWAWGFVLLMKFFLIFSLIWIVWRGEYKTERYMFFVMTLFTFLLVGQAYGAYTGIRASIQVSDYEEKHGPMTLEVRDMIRIETKEGAVKTYPTKVFWISIFPLIVANLSFYIFEKTLPYARLKKRRWYNAKKDEKPAYSSG